MLNVNEYTVLYNTYAWFENVLNLGIFLFYAAPGSSLFQVRAGDFDSCTSLNVRTIIIINPIIHYIV